MTYARITIVTALITMTACPPPAASTTDTDPGPTDPATDTSDASTTSTSGETPTSGDTTTDGSTPTEGTTTTETTTSGTETDGDTETTGTPSAVGPARVYYSAGPDGLPRFFRLVEVVDGVASAPVTVVDMGPAADEIGTSVADGQQTLALRAGGPGGPKMWFVDTATAETSELELPPAIDAIDTMSFSPDGSRLMISGGTESKRDMYVCEVGPASCTPGLMNPPLAGAGTIESYSPFAMSSGNTWLVYSVDGDNGGLDIMVGRVDTPGVASKVLSFLSPAMTMRVAAFTADEQFLYVGLADSDLDRVDFFAVDLSQQPLVAQSLDLPMEEAPYGLLAPDLHAILMWDGQGSNGDLYLVPLEGTSLGEPVWLNEAGPGRAKNRRFRWADDGSRAAFVTDHEVPGTDALYVVDGAGAEAPVKRSGPLPAGGTIEEIEFAPDASRLSFLASVQGEQPELFLAELTAPGVATKVSLPLPPSGGITMSRWSRDSTRLLYVGRQESANIEELFVIQDLGGAPTSPAKVNPPLAPGDQVLPWFQFSSDGQRAFFQASPDFYSSPLFMAALPDDGPEKAVQISEPDEPVAYMLVFPPTP
ncbi:hypothetical protein [Nannocystis pusilla]|uniref:Uncharacterized protein n=1 Tax=Nannocystis pusilla TaxID=889268 RepID=A0ABS7TUD4_9BACT|nr:hypothetical protein [Nannocystis pusilla]MBZ5711863.1 hypothetical protein [Nannocystis pusilla]